MSRIVAAYRYTMPNWRTPYTGADEITEEELYRNAGWWTLWGDFDLETRSFRTPQDDANLYLVIARRKVNPYDRQSGHVAGVLVLQRPGGPELWGSEL